MALTKEDLQAIGTLLEPIKTDIQGLKSDVGAINKRLDSVEESLQIVRASQMRVELEQYPRIAAALDGVAGGNEKNKEQDSRISVLEDKAENQGNRILALEYAYKTK